MTYIPEQPESELDIGDFYNLELTYTSGGVVTIGGVNGSILSVDNPAYICLPKVSNPKQKIALKLTSNVTFKDGDNVDSDIDNSMWVDDGAPADHLARLVYILAHNGDDTDNGLFFSLSPFPSTPTLVYLDELPWTVDNELTYLSALALRNAPATPYSNFRTATIGGCLLKMKTYGWAIDKLSYTGQLLGQAGFENLYQSFSGTSSVCYPTDNDWSGYCNYSLAPDYSCRAWYFVDVDTVNNSDPISTLRLPLYNYIGTPRVLGQIRGHTSPYNEMTIIAKAIRNVRFTGAGQYAAGMVNIVKADGSPILNSDLYALDTDSVRLEFVLDFKFD